MNNTLQRFCFILLCSALVTCRHEPVVPPPQCAYDSSVEEMKKWYYFKTGTWWVYEEQTTGEFDTVTVYSHEEGVSQGGFDFFNYYVHHSFDGFDVNYYFNASFSIHCLTKEECTCHKVLRSRFKPGNYIGEGWIFLFPMIEGNYNWVMSSDGTFWGKSLLSEINEFMYVGTIEYSQVAVWNVAVDVSENDQPSNYYIAKHLGIVRRELPEQNENWILVDFNIIQ